MTEPKTPTRHALHQEPARDLESVRSDHYLRIYANSAQIEMSVWDFQLVFGEIVKSDGKLGIEQSVSVVMSPQHAKALAGILESFLNEYESKVGEIKLPPPKSQDKELPVGNKK